MLEDALRDTFAAKAGTAPPGSLDGVADAAITGAHRLRRRRRAMATGLAGFVVLAITAITTFHLAMSPAAQVPLVVNAGGQVTPADASPAPQATRTVATQPPAANREVDAIGGSAQAAKKVRLQLPDKGTVAAAYEAKDGYLVVNTQPDGGKQLVLQDDNNKSQVLVDDASNIAVAKDGGQVAWASAGTMNVATRGNDNKKLDKGPTVEVPDTAVPVTFVGGDLVLGREEGSGFDVWYTGRGYTQSWDSSVLWVFGAHPDGKSIYAEVKAADPDKPMCLALLLLDQPFKVKEKLCGLPPAARAGSRISPDGHWLAYPVQGAKQVAILDLTKVFTGGKPNLWNLAVTGKTVWLNATTFVVDNGSKFLALNPAAQDGRFETMNQPSDGVVLIEPLYAG